MTKEEAGKLAAVMQAYADGKTIQIHQTYPSKWLDVSNPAFDFKEYDYRIKPEPCTIPYTLETFQEALRQHSPAVRFKSIDSKSVYILSVANEHGIICGVNNTTLSYEYMFRTYVWADTGEPFGQTVNE